MNMEDSKRPELDIFKLMQPELLPIEELVDILRQRGVGPVLLSQSKDKLVSLFRRVALPLPQRKLRDNYRGNLLKKLRRKAERISIDDSSSSDSKSFTIGVTGNARLTKSNGREERTTCERLKPPPDFVNHERKKIRLNSGGSSSVTIKTNRTTSDLDNIVINKRRKTSDSSIESHTSENGVKEGTDETVTSGLKKEKESQSDKNKTNEEKTINGVKTSKVPCKKVSLKRNRFDITTAASPGSDPATKKSNKSTEKAEVVTEKPEIATEKLEIATEKPEVSTVKSPSESEKKRKLISWP